MKRIQQLLILLSVLLIATAFGCDRTGGMPGTTDTNDWSGTANTGNSSGANPAAPGAYKMCTYNPNSFNRDYASAIVYYPCSGNGPFAATTLTGGYTNTKEDMDWLGSHIVTHGYIVYAMTPNNNVGLNPQWTQAHKAGISMLKSENSRSGSPIQGKVNTNALQIMGFSKGGGGALIATNALGGQLKSSQALAPYLDTFQSLNSVRAATICYTGTKDKIAPPMNVVMMYNNLPRSIDRTLAYFQDINHVDWMGRSGNSRDRLKTYITGWMKVYLDNDTSYNNYINGSQNGWFFRFEHQNAGSGGGAINPVGCN